MPEEGVLSLPFRLGISMLVIAVAMPICLQSLADGRSELSRDAAVGIAARIADAVSEVAHRSIGESRVLRIGESLLDIGKGTSIVIGDLFGGKNYSLIRCSDDSGWSRIVPIDLPQDTDAVCSSLYLPLTLSSTPTDIEISHRGSQSEDVIILEGT